MANQTMTSFLMNHYGLNHLEATNKAEWLSKELEGAELEEKKAIWNEFVVHCL